MANLIELKNIFKIYGEGLESEVRALDGVSLSIQRGEFVAIVGQSGSGKSTMMNVLGCLDIPTRGDYLLDGTDVRELTDTELSRIRNKEIGFIFQQYNLIQTLTVLENVELPLIYQGIRADDRYDMALEALDRVGLSNRVKHKPTEMSGGQQQRVELYPFQLSGGMARRVLIACAVMESPRLVIADEPTPGMSLDQAKEALRMFRDLADEGRSVILITHDNGIAATARRCVRLTDGKIVEDKEQEVDWF